MPTTQYLVSFTQQDIYDADASHLNGQTIAQHIRITLQGSGGYYVPDDWEWSLLSNTKVTPIRDTAPPGPGKPLTPQFIRLVETVLEGLEPMSGNTTIQQAIEVLQLLCNRSNQSN